MSKDVSKIVSKLSKSISDITGDTDCIIIGAFPESDGTTSLQYMNGNGLKLIAGLSHVLSELSNEDNGEYISTSICTAISHHFNIPAEEIMDLITKYNIKH